MNNKIKKIKHYIKAIHLPTILLIVALYLLLCLYCYLVLRREGTNTPFWDIVIFNFLAVTGNDYAYVDNPLTRIAGIFV